MAELQDVILYLCQKYPHQDQLSNARLTKMVYLADWRSAIQRGKTITSIQWYFNHFGPWVGDVKEAADLSSDSLETVETQNAYGEKKLLFKAKKHARPPRLLPEESKILDEVITTTQDLNWNRFISLVYSTYPIRSNPRYSKLDLLSDAKLYTRTP